MLAKIKTQALAAALVLLGALPAAALCPDEHDEAVDCQTPATPCKPGSSERAGQIGCSGVFLQVFEDLPVHLIWSSQGDRLSDEGVGAGILAPWSTAVQQLRPGVLGIRNADHSIAEFIATSSPNLYVSTSGNRLTLRKESGAYILEDALDASTARFEKKIGDRVFVTSERTRSGLGIDIEWGERYPVRIKDRITGRAIDVQVEDGHVVSLSDGRGRQFQLSYAGDLLSEITYPDGVKQALTWTSDGSNFLTEVSEPVRVHALKMTYYANGVIKSFAQGPLVGQYQYPTADTVVGLEFDPSGKLSQLSRTDYKDGYISRVLIGNGTQSDPSDPNTMIVAGRFEFDALGRLTKKWDSAGFSQQLFYRKDGSCQTGSTNAEDLGMEPTCIQQQDGTQITMMRDSKTGLPLSAKTYGPGNTLISTLQNSYSADHRVVESQLENALDPAARARFKIEYAADSRLAMSSEVSIVQNFQYDSLGRVVKATAPGEVRTYEYADTGDIAALISPHR